MKGISANFVAAQQDAWLISWRPPCVRRQLSRHASHDVFPRRSKPCNSQSGCCNTIENVMHTKALHLQPQA